MPRPALLFALAAAIALVGALTIVLRDGAEPPAAQPSPTAVTPQPGTSPTPGAPTGSPAPDASPTPGTSPGPDGSPGPPVPDVDGPIPPPPPATPELPNTGGGSPLPVAGLLAAAAGAGLATGRSQRPGRRDG